MIYTIGISGGSGSGKTTFIRELLKAFDESDVTILSQDNYYRKREEQPKDETGTKNFDTPFSIDEEQYTKDLKALLSGQPIELTEYTFNNPNAKPDRFIIKPAPLLVVEGIFVLHYKEIAELLDYKVFLEVEEQKRLARRLNRDLKERNYPADDVLYRFYNHVKPTFNEFILPYRNDCDLIVNNDHAFGGRSGRIGKTYQESTGGKLS